MVFIYCIEDLNGLKYIGSTKNSLNIRLTGHRQRKTCSSNKLNLKDCKIYSLEECTEENRKVREQYWIDNTECVNIKNTMFNKRVWTSSEKNKQRKRNTYHYENSWGGDYRYHNNLLKIDPNIFL